MISSNFDPYLQDLPQELNQYGLNKTLITRALTIDWKHRDTEIHHPVAPAFPFQTIL